MDKGTELKGIIGHVNKENNAAEALDELNEIVEYITEDKKVKYKSTILFDCEIIKDALLKTQEQEKENELLKEIIKSFFDRGCPLHQYTNKKGELLIEVDDDCSTIILGEYKGVNLDKYLKEVLESEN